MLEPNRRLHMDLVRLAPPLGQVQQVRIVSPGAFWAYENGIVEQEDR